MIQSTLHIFRFLALINSSMQTQLNERWTHNGPDIKSSLLFDVGELIDGSDLKIRD